MRKRMELEPIENLTLPVYFLPSSVYTSIAVYKFVYINIIFFFRKIFTGFPLRWYHWVPDKRRNNRRFYLFILRFSHGFVRCYSASSSGQ